MEYTESMGSLVGLGFVLFFGSLGLVGTLFLIGIGISIFSAIFSSSSDKPTPPITTKNNSISDDLNTPPDYWYDPYEH